MNVRAGFSKIFLELGLERMSTSNSLEPSFWNFDALSQPQKHHARDAHDTFLKYPDASNSFCLSSIIDRTIFVSLAVLIL
ncbi:MAG: hypothetical protein J3Q66DRAFT_70304 [Benniella sp.]|nr:MAG: hypothetical protein J3Q66DRAFT_70304 [Benniella sp.]